MSDKIIPANMFQFDFLGYGEMLETFPEHKDSIFLDVGNRLGPGVIDHHHLSAYSGSAAGLLLLHPDFIAASINPERRPDTPFTIITHIKPDLDCVASAFLSIAHLSTGIFPDGSEALARYVDKVDSGFIGLSQENPFSLYSAYMYLTHRFSQFTWEKREDMWRECLINGIKIIDFVLKKMVRENISIMKVDAFQCFGLFSNRDRLELKLDMERYQSKLSDKKTHARQLRLSLPGHLGGTENVDVLLVRNVQNADDPERCMFFKDWARTDTERSPGKKGFTGLSVFEFNQSSSNRSLSTGRSIISVKPESGVSLKGLGSLMDQAESEERKKHYGFDDRIKDPKTGEKKKSREGYSNSDPWYDGRAHGYTIIDSPRSGSLLSPEQIEDIFISFGSGAGTDYKPLRIGCEDTSTSDSPGSEESIVQLSYAVNAWRENHVIEADPGDAEIFISYPRKRIDWVTKHIYEPLSLCHGKEKIFFDKQSLESGAGWLSVLADKVSQCRIFLPIYCSEYFDSMFCEYELQLAVIRDPMGKKRIVTPLMIEPVSLPNYCSLIQAINIEGLNIEKDIVGLIGDISNRV